jgi:prepilin-type N-terminal cleavage/methylation domain-containing protein
MMNRQIRHNGFSLTEVLIATGILALGLVMIAMAFPVGVKLASIATERPVGVVAGNEALAKMRLYGIKPFSDNASWNRPPNDPNKTCTDYWLVYANAATAQQMTVSQIDDQRCYPSLVPQPQERRYYWSALVRRADSNTNQIQATVFVCRMLGMGSSYFIIDGVTTSPRYGKVNGNTGLMPVPVKVQVQKLVSAIYPNRVLKILPDFAGNPEYNFFKEGSMLLEDSNGQICRVIEMKDLDADQNRDLILQNDYNGPAIGGFVWVVPPAVGSSRNPCIDIVQTVLAIP